MRNKTKALIDYLCYHYGTVNRNEVRKHLPKKGQVWKPRTEATHWGNELREFTVKQFKGKNTDNLVELFHSFFAKLCIAEAAYHKAHPSSYSKGDYPEDIGVMRNAMGMLGLIIIELAARNNICVDTNDLRYSKAYPDDLLGTFNEGLYYSIYHDTAYMVELFSQASYAALFYKYKDENTPLINMMMQIKEGE
jgi:hypothetical protein